MAADQQLSPLPDGRFRMTATVHDTVQLRLWLQSQGGFIEVLQPAALLLVEKMEEIASIQAQAIQDLPIEKVIVWDGGGEGGGMSGLGKRLMGALPPMHELARQIGL